MILNKKVFLVVILLLALTLSAVGCKKKDSTPDAPVTDNQGSSPSTPETPSGDASNTVYSTEIPCNIVVGSSSATEIAFLIQEAIYEETDLIGTLLQKAPDNYTDHMIYLGRTGSALSNKAYSILENAVDNAELDAGGNAVFVGYVIYAQGNSIAIAYSDDMYDSTGEVACEDFVNNIIKGREALRVSDGTIKKETYDYIAFLEKVDEEYYDKAWDTLAKKLNNPDLVEALKKLKSLYGNGAVSWLANLYDEEIGAFYYSNSGRNNVGFLPDADSTYQAILLVGHMGMQEDFGYGRGSYPENFWYKIGTFVKKLQDPNGYFYHPQWTKEMVDAKLSRRGRDLDRSEQLLRAAGMKPTYDTPNGTKGDGLVWDESVGGFVSPESLVQPLSSLSVATAVSAVIPTSTAAVADHLKTKEALEAYLQKFLDDGKNFYPINNELANQTNQIIARDKQLAASGANWRCAEIIIAFLNKHQNSENGSWSNATDYNAVDGLFKAAHVYTNLGYEIPNAMAAAMTALNAITAANQPPYDFLSLSPRSSRRFAPRSARRFAPRSARRFARACSRSCRRLAFACARAR